MYTTNGMREDSIKKLTGRTLQNKNKSDLSINANKQFYVVTVTNSRPITYSSQHLYKFVKTLTCGLSQMEFLKL